jgi:threonylcarbamoyladenosine tRNA methylthiotransferase MtaB
MFENSVRLVEECGLSFVHVFPFSPREGTPAARMPQLDRVLVKARAARLREAAAAAEARHNARRSGTAARLLIERAGWGRDADFTLARFTGPARPGEIVDAILSFGPDGVMDALPQMQSVA